MIPKGRVGAFVHSVYHFPSIALVDELESFQCQGTTIMFSRRQLLAVSAVGAAMTTADTRAQTFGNPDLPPQGAINAKAPGNLSDPGPHCDRRSISFGAIAAAHRCRRHAAHLGVLQQRAKTHSERRLGAPGHGR
jgi:hypothetical protein